MAEGSSGRMDPGATDSRPPPAGDPATPSSGAWEEAIAAALEGTESDRLRSPLDRRPGFKTVVPGAVITAFVAVWAWSLASMSGPPAPLDPAEQGADLRTAAAMFALAVNAYRDETGTLPTDLSGFRAPPMVRYERRGDGYVISAGAGDVQVDLHGEIDPSAFLDREMDPSVFLGRGR